MKRFSLLLAVAGISTIASAEIRLPNFFADHMVLQQQISNTIWGWAEPGEKISVTASWGAEGNTTTSDKGQWRIYLETPEHGTGHSLTIKGNNSIELNDVAVGEVWLCAGQSNICLLYTSPSPRD